MNWKAILGRVLGALPALALLIFGIAGYTPEWWQGMVAVTVPFLTWLIGQIPDKT